jgi:CHAT domain-containing protein
MRRTIITATVLTSATISLLVWFQHSRATPSAPPPRVLEARLSSASYAPLDVHRASAPSGERALEERLARSVAENPGDPGTLNDLAATELALGDVADAAEHAARALELSPSHQSAAFNWALALEKLCNRPMAIEAWEAYLRLDSRSGWADEARLHLAHFREPRPNWKEDGAELRTDASEATVRRIVQAYPQRSRAKALNELLPSWIAKGDAADLVLLRRIAAVRETSGDPFLRDAVEYAAADRTHVADGISAYGAAAAAEGTMRMEDAGARYTDAAKKLRNADPPVAIAALVRAASSDNYAGRNDALRDKLAEADELLAASGRRYPSMAAEIAWVRGLDCLRAGRPNDALALWRGALADVRRVGEREHEASITSLIASNMEGIADPTEAELLRRDALRRLDDLNAESRPMYLAYLETGTNSLRAGRPRVSLSFLDAARAIGRADNNAMYVADAEAWRALALVDIGRIPDATDAVAAARAELPSIETPGFRERTLGNLAFIAGRIGTKQDPQRAVEAFDEAVAIWKRKDWHQHVASVYVARGEAHEAAGNRSAAEADFRASIAEMEGQRQNLTEPAMRISYFERSDGAFVRLIRLLVDERRFDEALSVAEQKRARALLDRIGSGGTASPLTADEVAARVGGDVGLLEVALLDRGAELFLVHRGRIMHARSTASREEIETVVNRHLAAIAADDLPAVRRDGRWLFEQLVRPAAAQLPRGANLVIVPDGILQMLPFATLVAADGAFLIDRYALTTAPSASVFLRERKPSNGEEAIAVVQPAPSGYMPLPKALNDAASFSRTWSHSRLFVGLDCGPSCFLDETSRATLVHYSGHALTDSYRPSQSALVFESATGEPAMLTAETIARSHLESSPLIVLAACSTARGRLRRNEGIDSLASAFLQAGARGVVATLWDVDDAAASRLFRAFHQHLRAGARASDALRDAQRSLMHGTDSSGRRVSSWGGAVIIGIL